MKIQKMFKVDSRKLPGIFRVKCCKRRAALCLRSGVQAGGGLTEGQAAHTVGGPEEQPSESPVGTGYMPK